MNFCIRCWYWTGSTVPDHTGILHFAAAFLLMDEEVKGCLK